MSIIKRLLRRSGLSLSDLPLLIEALFLLSAIRVGLWLLPFRRVRAIVQKTQPEGTAGLRKQRGITKTVCAVEFICRNISPLKNCLTKALATQMLLSRRGHFADLRIGVVKTGVEALKAHAWVENEDGVLVGDVDDLVLYTALLPFNRNEQ